jgi:dihydropteroate synthase
MFVPTLESTPGPWYLLSGHDGYVEISNTPTHEWTKPEHYVCRTRRGNAHLIAAAPELFVALGEALLLASDESGEVLGGNLQARETAIIAWKRQAEAALARALGVSFAHVHDR